MAPTISEIIDHHVTLEVESIDRMYLNGYIPGLQSPGGVAWFLRKRRGARFASSMLLDPISRDFADGYAFLVHFGGELGVSASWYNILFTAVVRWFEFCSQVVVLKGLRPQRRPSRPPRSWSVSDPDIRTFEAIANRQAQRWASTRSRYKNEQRCFSLSRHGRGARS